MTLQPQGRKKMRKCASSREKGEGGGVSHTEHFRGSLHDTRKKGGGGKKTIGKSEKEGGKEKRFSSAYNSQEKMGKKPPLQLQIHQLSTFRETTQKGKIEGGLRFSPLNHEKGKGKKKKYHRLPLKRKSATELRLNQGGRKKKKRSCLEEKQTKTPRHSKETFSLAGKEKEKKGG